MVGGIYGFRAVDGPKPRSTKWEKERIENALGASICQRSLMSLKVANIIARTAVEKMSVALDSVPIAGREPGAIRVFAPSVEPAS